MEKVPFLVGPTASGKTTAAVIIGERWNAEIISADSRQIYREMAIGTAQPSSEELRRIPHHFVACLDPDQNFSAGEYGRQAREKILALLKKRKIPFVVGGSGLYISALADDFFTGPSADPEIRRELKQTAQKEGVHHLYRQLQEVDTETAEKTSPSDYRRIERALEIYRLTGVPISEMRRQKANPPPYQPVIAGLKWDRKVLYQRINHRCLKMLEDGLIEEVSKLIEGKNLNAPDFFTNYNALNSVGYVEVIQYLNREIDYDEMVRLFQRNTRRFAKRQMSWFGRDKRIIWVDISADDSAREIAEQLMQIYRQSGVERIERNPE
jgi:tRNA dimethylallyltransferase